MLFSLTALTGANSVMHPPPEQVSSRRVSFQDNLITGAPLVEEIPIPTVSEEERLEKERRKREKHAIQKQNDQIKAHQQTIRLMQMQAQMQSLMQKQEHMHTHLQKQDQMLEQILALLVQSPHEQIASASVHHEQIASVPVPHAQIEPAYVVQVHSVMGPDTLARNMEPMFVQVPPIPIQLASSLQVPDIIG